MRRALAVAVALFAVAALGDDPPGDPPGFGCRIPLHLPCRASAATPWDLPSCDDYDFDAALIESAKNGDHSAADLLLQRFATTFTYEQRLRIGAALLGRVDDDSAVWKELAVHAENAVDFHAGTDEAQAKSEAWCAEHDCDPAQYDRLAWQALVDIAADRRARPLLRRALASADTGLVEDAIRGLAGQHDESSLPAIEETLRRLPEDASTLALLLADFKSEAADRLAMKYLNDEDRDDYEEERGQV